MLLFAPTQILARLGWLLLALSIAFGAALVGLRTIESRATREIIDDEADEHGRLLDDLLTRAATPLRLFTDSYARRTSFTRPQQTSRSVDPDATLRAGLRTFGLQAAWVLEADGAVRLFESDAAQNATALMAAPLTPAEITTVRSRTTRFYMERQGVIYLVRGTRLATDSTRPEAPRGWLFAAMRWDVKDLSAPSMPLDGRTSLLPPDETGQPATKEYPLRIERLLRDFSNQPLRVLRQECRPPEIDVVASMDWLQTLVMAAFGIVSIGVLAFCLVRWVIVPAGVMQRSLTHRDPTVLGPLLARGGFVGELAELVRQLMETRTQLERTLDERARLGRELHDGVIQTVYAAGMGLASVRATLHSNPAEAETLLDQTRTELNSTIIDLRAFIKGLEVDDPQLRKFSAAVGSITALSRAGSAIRFALEIDDTVAGTFSATERMQLLQIVREAVSNAVRHSGASAVTVRLRRGPTEAVLEVSDNGKGFDPAALGDDGRGLGNLHIRAGELGGTIEIDSGEYSGTRVRLVLPRPS